MEQDESSGTEATFGTGWTCDIRGGARGGIQGRHVEGAAALRGLAVLHKGSQHPNGVVFDVLQNSLLALAFLSVWLR